MSEMKPKRVLSEEALANLARARDAARLRRLQIGEVTRLKKEVLLKDEKDTIATLKSKLAPAQAPAAQAQAPQALPVGRDRQAPGDEADEEDEEQEVVVRKKAKRKPIVIIEDSGSESDDEQVVYVKRRSQRPPVAAAAPPVPVPVQQVPVSMYAGMHPSMLSGRRR